MTNFAGKSIWHSKINSSQTSRPVRHTEDRNSRSIETMNTKHAIWFKLNKQLQAQMLRRAEHGSYPKKGAILSDDRVTEMSRLGFQLRNQGLLEIHSHIVETHDRRRIFLLPIISKQRKDPAVSVVEVAELDRLL